jgi:hypothetical protein
MVSLKMVTTFVMHAMILVIRAVVALVVVVVIVIAVNHCPALHSQPFCPLADLKSSRTFKIILCILAKIFQAKFLKQ